MSGDRNEKKQDLTHGPVAAHLRRQGTPFALGLVAIFSFEAASWATRPWPLSASPCP